MIAAPFFGTDEGGILMQLSVLSFVIAGLSIMIPIEAARKLGVQTLILGVVSAVFSSFAMGLFR